MQAVENSLDRLEELRSMDRRGLRRMLTQDLIKKYCHLVYISFLVYISLLIYLVLCRKNQGTSERSYT